MPDAWAQSTVASQSRSYADWVKAADQAQQWLSLDETQQERIGLPEWENLQVQLSLAAQYALDEAEGSNLESRILLAQLAELGPLPTADSPEDQWIADLRALLNERLAATEAPLLQLRDLHARATVLSREVGKVVDRRNRIELLSGSASPLLPRFWVAASRDIAQISSGAGKPLIRAPETTRVIVAGLILFGLALAWLAHYWVLRGVGRIENRLPTARTQLVAAFARDMLGIVSPLLFFGLVVAAISALSPGLPGAGFLATAIIGAVLVFVLVRWLGRSLFMPSFQPARMFNLSPRYEQRAYRASLLLAGFMAAQSITASIHEKYPEYDGLYSALTFAAVTGLCFAMWRLLRTVNHGLVEQAQQTQQRTDNVRKVLLTPVAQIARIALVLAFLAGLFGFVKLSTYLVSSMIGTLAVIFGLVFVFRSVSAAVEALQGERAGRRPTAIQLLPVLFGLVLACLALPLIALFWGYSVGHIVDIFIAIKNGVTIGQVRISFGGVVRFAIVFIVGYALTRWLQQALQYVILNRMEVDRGAQSAILTGVGYVGLFLSALVAITAAGLDLSSLAVVAGALGVGIGFGLQSIVANFISGLILLIERPIREGDWIEVGGFSGHVSKIAFRSTHIETFDRQEVIIPNSDLITGKVTNFTYGNNEGRLNLSVDVAYESDMAAARAVLLRIAASHAEVLKDPPPTVTLSSFGDSSIKLVLICFVSDINMRAGVMSDLGFAVAEAAQAGEIDIPYPRREVTIIDPTAKPTKRARPPKPAAG